MKRDASGQLAAALAEANARLASAPGDAEALAARAHALFAWRRHREAYTIGTAALQQGARGTEVLLEMGWSAFALSNVPESVDWFRRAVAASPQRADAHLNLAVGLHACGFVADARDHFMTALSLHIGDLDALIGLGRCHFDMEAFPEAEAQFRQAVALHPQATAAWEHLGTSIGRQGRYEEALQAIAAAHQRVVADDDDTFVRLAIALSDGGHFDAALRLYQDNLPTRPSIDGLYAYSHLLLKLGRLSEGWHYHEFRWLVEPQVSRRLVCGQPPWHGQDLLGMTILLHVEQGFGDILQFVRYAPMVKARGARVMLRVAVEMATLALRFPGVDDVIVGDQPLPPFDYFAHVMDLPRLFGTTLQTIPAAVPYIRAGSVPDPLTPLPTRSASSRRRIGLAWAGNPKHANDRNRSLQLEKLAAFASIEGVEFVSLQKDVSLSTQAQFPWINYAAPLTDFDTSATFVTSLDLVICVDTAMAHLAGALGVPVWLLTPSPADWRWLEGRDDSPWYPTMRLFRQVVRGEWADPVARLVSALADWATAASASTVSAAIAQVVTPPQVVKHSLPRTAPGHLRGSSHVTECRDGIMQYLPDEPLVGDALGWYGEFLPQQVDLLRGVLPDHAVALEANAGVGHHAIGLSAHLARGHLYLYEARPVMHRLLQQNLAANHVRNATLLRRYLTREPEREPMSREHENIDDLVLDRLDCIKVNAGEVAALDVLDGAIETLWRCRPVLMLAASDEDDMNALAAAAREYGYRCWRMEVPLFNNANFYRRSDDVFAGRAALAMVGVPEEVDVDVALPCCDEL